MWLLVSHTSDLHGAEICLRDLASGLVARGHTLKVLCPEEGPLTASLRQAGVCVVCHPLPRLQRDWRGLLKFIVSWLPTVWWLRRFLRQEGVTAVHNNTIDALYAPFATWQSPTPCIWHIHEVKPDHPKLRLLFAWLLQKIPSRVIFNSQDTLSAYSQTPYPHWQVIYNGISLPNTAPPSPSPLDSGPVRVGYVGQFVPLKHPERFLHALSQSRLLVPTLQGIMAGDGPLRPQAHQLAAQLGLSDAVHFPGYVAQIETIYQQIDILVLTSEREGFGRVLVEAMAAGVPVIAGNVGGLPEVIQDTVTGYLVPADDISAYADKIVRLAQDTALRHQMGQSAQQWVQQRFSLTSYLIQMEAALQQTAMRK